MDDLSEPQMSKVKLYLSDEDRNDVILNRAPWKARNKPVKYDSYVPK